MARYLASLLLGLAAGCGPRTTPKPVEPPPPPMSTTELVPGVHPLITGGAPGSGGERARIATYSVVAVREGRDWVSVLTEPVQVDPEGGGDLVVVAETGEAHVRILQEQDDARLLLWILRSDLAEVIVAEVGLQTYGDGAVGARGSPGVVLGAGAPVRTGAIRGGGAQVTIEAEGLVIRGILSVAAFGVVWTDVPVEVPAPTHHLEELDEIRLTAADAGQVLAVATGDVAVRRIGDAGGAWAEIETVGPLVIVRGFVRDADLEQGGTVDAWVGDPVGGYGRSETIDIALPAGACLYDVADGAPIGVNLVARDRLGYHGDQPGWSTVLVDSAWGLLELAVHATGPEEAPVWDLCASP